MNAPETKLEEITQHKDIALDQLVPSKTNPRKRKGFDEKSLNEMAATIRLVGVAQPILVREYSPVANKTKDTWPFPTKGDPDNRPRYEIIAGERRYRAAMIAGLTHVPVLVKTLTDQQVLQIQLIENKQREDLDELEEAEGYEKLMQEKDTAGNAYTADIIAETMGVSRSTIYGRLTLLKLCPEAREAFYQGVLDASRALLIARIPSHKNQISALKKITNTVPYGTQWLASGDPMSYRRARDLIQEDYMLDLDRAHFDIKDAALLPKAGSCKDCAKRTGNQPELFEDVKSKDVCTDPGCHALKKAAHMLAIQKAAEAKGHEVIVGKAAKKLMPDRYKQPESQLRQHGYATLDTPIPGDEQKRNLGQMLKEAKLLTPAKDSGKPSVQKTVVEDPFHAGKMIETVNIEAATKALREAGFEITLKGKPQQQAAQDNSEQREKEAEQLKIENVWRGRLFDTLHQRIEGEFANPQSTIFAALYRRLAVAAFGELYCDETLDVLRLAQKYDASLIGIENKPDVDPWSHIKTFEDKIPTFTTQQHAMLLFDLLMVDEISTKWIRNDGPKTMCEIAANIGIDADAMKKTIKAESKAAQKPAKTAFSPTAAAPATKKTAEKTKAAQAAKTTA